MNDDKLRQSSQLEAIENEVVGDGNDNCENNGDEKYWIDKDAIKSAKERAENCNKISKHKNIYWF